MATLLMTAFFQRHSIRMKMAIVYVQYASFLDRHQPKRIQDLLGSRWVQQFQCILWNFMFLYKIYLVIIVDLIFVNCHWILVCKINASEIDFNFTPAFFLYNLWWNVTSLNVSNHNILHIWTIFLSVYKLVHLPDLTLESLQVFVLPFPPQAQTVVDEMSLSPECVLLSFIFKNNISNRLYQRLFLIL